MAEIGKPVRRIRIEPEPLPDPEEIAPAEPGPSKEGTSSR